MRVLYAISWTEYERGWGQRPDGISFHTDEAKALAFIKHIHGDRSGSVPDEYSNADGPPRLVEVSEALYEHVYDRGGNYWSRMNSFHNARNWSVLNPKGV